MSISPESAERLSDIFREDVASQEVIGGRKSMSMAEGVMLAADPSVDFLTGAQLAGNDEALSAARKEVEMRIKSVRQELSVVWDGTRARIMDGKTLVDKTEIHGATWNRSSGEARGVRFDISGLKDSTKA